MAGLERRDGRQAYLFDDRTLALRREGGFGGADVGSERVVVVQLALQGTHDGPLQLPFGELRATGKQMDAPCSDVFVLEDGKIKRFDCYPEGSIILAQLGVLNNLDAALTR